MMFNCRIKQWCARQQNPHPDNDSRNPKSLGCGLGGLRAFLPHLTFPTLHPWIFLGVFLSWISSLDWVTDLRTRWTSTGGILVQGREQREGTSIPSWGWGWAEGRDMNSQLGMRNLEEILDFGKPQSVQAQDTQTPDKRNLQLMLFPWENPSPAGSWFSASRIPEAHLDIKQGPVGV